MLGHLLLLALLAGQAQDLENAVDAPAAAPPTEDDLKQRLAAQPAAVRDFIERRAGCNHWTGEEPYDADRRREIEAEIADLRCQAIEADEAAVRRQFADHPDTLQLLDDTSQRDGW